MRTEYRTLLCMSAQFEPNCICMDSISLNENVADIHQLQVSLQAQPVAAGPVAAPVCKLSMCRTVYCSSSFCAVAQLDSAAWRKRISWLFQH